MTRGRRSSPSAPAKPHPSPIAERRRLSRPVQTLLALHSYMWQRNKYHKHLWDIYRVGSIRIVATIEWNMDVLELQDYIPRWWTTLP